MRTYPLFILLFTVLVSWGIGFYFISVVNTPTIIIPLFNDYLWMNEYKGFLGLPIVFTLTTVPAALYLFQRRKSMKKTWYTVFSTSQLFWVATIAVQLKVIAFNLGICH